MISRSVLIQRQSSKMSWYFFTEQEVHKLPFFQGDHVRDKSLHIIDPARLGPGSEVNDQQFALFRTYSPRTRSVRGFSEYSTEELGLDNARTMAKAFKPLRSIRKHGTIEISFRNPNPLPILIRDPRLLQTTSSFSLQEPSSFDRHLSALAISDGLIGASKKPSERVKRRPRK